jgi:hypothetical protein
MRTFLAVCAFALSACATGPQELDGGELADAGRDAGAQCNDDHTSCWAPETFCEQGSVPCTFQFPDTGARCGAEAIRPSCFCTRELDGGFRQLCTGGCPPGPDGGPVILCITPTCGTLSCALPARCVAYGRCE